MKLKSLFQLQNRDFNMKNAYKFCFSFLVSSHFLEKFVNALGEMSKKYWEYKFNNIQNKKRIVVTDDNDVIHFLLISEVIYINAVGRNSIIHTTSGTQFRIRKSISDFISKFKDYFTVIHRSYVINNSYISCIQRYEVIMIDGSKIPIPKKRYKEIREELINIK